MNDALVLGLVCGLLAGLGLGSALALGLVVPRLRSSTDGLEALLGDCFKHIFAAKVAAETGQTGPMLGPLVRNLSRSHDLPRLVTQGEEIEDLNRPLIPFVAEHDRMDFTGGFGNFEGLELSNPILLDDEEPKNADTPQG